VVALFGLILLTLRGGEATYQEWWGDFLTALGAFAYAVQIVLVEKFSQEDTLPLVTAEMATVTCLSLMLFLVSGNRNLSLSFSQWLSIGFLGVVATALTFTVQKLAQKHTPAIHAGLIFISEPVFAAFFSYFLWQERFTSAAVAGCIFILLGILLPQIRTLVIPDAPLLEQRLFLNSIQRIALPFEIGQNNLHRYFPPTFNFLKASSIRSIASARFSREFEKEMRMYPSPNSPKEVPGSTATPASSRR